MVLELGKWKAFISIIASAPFMLGNSEPITSQASYRVAKTIKGFFDFRPCSIYLSRRTTENEVRTAGLRHDLQDVVRTHWNCE